MANLILFDTDAHDHLLPLTATRPMAELRVGLLTVRQKWERWLEMPARSYITKEYLQQKFPIHIEYDNLLVNAGVLPTASLCRAIRSLTTHQALLHNDELIAARLTEAQIERLIEDVEVGQLEGIELDEEIELVQYGRLWQLLELNQSALISDFKLLTQSRVSQPLPKSNQLIGPADQLFIEPGASIEACIINTTNGPVYIGSDTVVMEGSMLRGPIGLCEGVIVKMGAKIYGPTVLGPGCRGGGEITRSIMTANSNKGHEGFLGDSILGEWCNIGADTNNSNLKNNYSEVKLWDYKNERFERTGMQFFGLVMGDHAKCGINTMFNTGTVVGVFANIYGGGYQRNFVPDFAWGGADTQYRTYLIKEAIATAELVLQRRGQSLSEADQAILTHICEITAKFRSWEK
jgi:UDP-N-acetylglucosamine diphosphorylase/glucosamine-1-phosphate N-acetyltransferase